VLLLGTPSEWVCGQSCFIVDVAFAIFVGAIFYMDRIFDIIAPYNELAVFYF
jgi:hypothetical protein